MKNSPYLNNRTAFDDLMDETIKKIRYYLSDDFEKEYMVAPAMLETPWDILMTPHQTDMTGMIEITCMKIPADMKAALSITHIPSLPPTAGLNRPLILRKH